MGELRRVRDVRPLRAEQAHGVGLPHDGGHEEAHLVDEVRPGEAAPRKAAPLQQQGADAEQGRQLAHGKGQVQRLPAGKQVGHAPVPQKGQIGVVHRFTQHLHHVGAVIARVLVGDAAGGPVQSAAGVQRHGVTGRVRVGHEVLPGEGPALKGRQIGRGVAGEAALHGHPAAQEGVRLELPVALVVVVQDGAQGRLVQKGAGDLAVHGDGHVIDDVGSVHKVSLRSGGPAGRSEIGRTGR